MKEHIEQLLQRLLADLGITDVNVQVTRPGDSTHGDYTTNVAMQLAKTLKKSPVSITTKLKEKIDAKIAAMEAKGRDTNVSKAIQNTTGNSTEIDILQAIAEIAVIPPGFINIKIKDFVFINQIDKVLKTDKPVVTRNPRKPEAEMFNITGPVEHFSHRHSQSLQHKNLDDHSGSLVTPSNARWESLYVRHPLDLLPYGWNTDHVGHRLMVEFAHPNTHKAFHIGHLRNITTGESLVRLLGAIGYDVIRANYQGDVGMHIAKALYALQNIEEIKSQISKLETTSQNSPLHPPKADFEGQAKLEEIQKRVEFLGKAYAAGSTAFEESDEVKKKVGEINKKIYARDPEVYLLYQETRQWSLDYFDSIYARVGTHYDRFYFESECYEKGKERVLEGLKKGVFKESDGAIIFPGERFGLHNRVFISGEGNPTYEAKDIELGPLQLAEYPGTEKIFHVVGPEQAGYFQVVFEALAQLYPETRGKEYHFIYGWVKLKHGKMSSRTGNVVLGEWLIDTVKEEIQKIMAQTISKDKEVDLETVSEALAIAAVKYSFLKVSTNSEIAFDLEESINIHGDSGPYLMYTYTRCRSVMRKAEEATQERKQESKKAGEEENGVASVASVAREQERSLAGVLNAEEREVAKLIQYFPEVVREAAENYAPSAICSYLFELAQAYNMFYTKHSILGNNTNEEKTKTFRLALTEATGTVLRNGLFLLGITTVERM